MFGLHLTDDAVREPDDGSPPVHPVARGFRALVLPCVVTPLGVTAVLVEALSGAGWQWRTAVAASYVAVATGLSFILSG